MARPPGRRFVRFSLVGIVGFGVDASVLALCLRLGFGVYDGRLISYLVAATTTWWLNRRFTFTGAADAKPALQWTKFLAVNAVGGAVNYCVYAVLVTWLPLAAAYPTLGVAAGSLAGLAFNFLGSRRLVFPDSRASTGGHRRVRRGTI